MARNRPDLQRNDETLASPGRRSVLSRWRTCGCGCSGDDPWHQWYYDRVIRNVTVHAEPVPHREAISDAFPATVEVARGTVRLPWSSEPVPVRAIVRVGSIYADWELVDLRS